jgi:hypothetical protein
MAVSEELGHYRHGDRIMVRTMKRRAIRWRLGAAAFTAALWCASCNIFSPRDSEQPVTPENVDPLNFAAIMEKSGSDGLGTGEKFTRLRYEDLFDDDLVYEDINSGVYTKGQLIQRLHQIQIQYPSIKITWDGGKWWKRSDTLIFTDITYSIEIMGAGSQIETGSSNFIVVKDWEWHIAQWRDAPGKPDKSFFSP